MIHCQKPSSYPQRLTFALLLWRDESASCACQNRLKQGGLETGRSVQMALTIPDMEDQVLKEAFH